MCLRSGHIQSLVAAPTEVREEIKKYKEAFTLAADKVGISFSPPFGFTFFRQEKH